MNYMDIQFSICEELSRTLSAVSPESVESLSDLILSAKRVFIAGAGRSGLMARGFAMRLMHMGLSAYVVGEMVTPAILPEDVLLIASGSGETGSLVNMAKKAKKIGAKIGLITIFPESTIGQLADAAVGIPAPTPKSDLENSASSIQPMGSLFEQSLFLLTDSMVLLMMEKTGTNAASMFARHANLE